MHSQHILQRINDVPFRFASPKYGIVHSNQTLKLRDEQERLTGVYISHNLHFDPRDLIPTQHCVQILCGFKKTVVSMIRVSFSSKRVQASRGGRIPNIFPSQRLKSISHSNANLSESIFRFKDFLIPDENRRFTECKFLLYVLAHFLFVEVKPHCPSCSL